MNLSVIIPLYNKRNNIKSTIESVLRQTVSDFELIVVDDGSTDGSGDIVAAIADDRICVVRQANQGVSVARNTGIATAKGDLLLFLDGDDLWEPFFIEEILSLSSSFPEAGLYATAYRYLDNGVYTKPRYKYIKNQSESQILDNYFRAAMGSAPVWTSATAIRKSVFSTVGMFALGIKNGEDLDMWARIALAYPIAWSPRPCATYNLSANNRCAGDLTNEDVYFVKYLCSDTRRNAWFIEYVIKARLGLASKMIMHKKYFSSFELMFKCLKLKVLSVWYLRFIYFIMKFSVRNLLNKNIADV